MVVEGLAHMMGNNLKTIKNFFISRRANAFLAGLLGILLLPVMASANNLKLSNFNVGETDTASNTMSFTFDLSHSWRNTTNHDAAWIFMKYSSDGGVTWHHASMASSGTNPVGFSVPSDFELIVPSDQKGFFIQRTSFGSGNVAAKGVKFVWNYGQDGLSDATAQAANTIHKIFGIEVIYIPQGAFYAGDGNSSSEFRFKQGSGDNDPWYITSENPITTTNSASDGFYYTSTGASGENNTADAFLIPASFPKGYQPFYLMKYELTEGEWVGFFNTLTPEQKVKRDVTAASLGGKNSDGVVTRNTVSWDSTHPAYNATTSRPSRPMSYLGWPDLAAYADWAGLRPMTELEFEKAARGKDISPVADEFTWGDTSYDVPGVGEITPANADEDGTEAVLDSASNLNRNNLGWTSGDGRIGGPADHQKGPLRVGIFAESSSLRNTSGAGYYGNLELSGNLAEPVVNIGRIEGRQFLGTNGDGELTVISGYEGNATNADWPGINANVVYGVNETKGIGYRGGDYASSSVRHFQTSSRTYAVKDPDSQGYFQRYDANYGVVTGGRLARTAP
jgi:formylglycine-generating enzyme required for sulfatase activity